MNTSVDATRQALDRARHVPGFVYTSAEVFARETERLFMRDCLCVAREEEIARPGSTTITDHIPTPPIADSSSAATRRVQA